MRKCLIDDFPEYKRYFEDGLFLNLYSYVSLDKRDNVRVFNSAFKNHVKSSFLDNITFSFELLWCCVFVHILSEKGHI
jgi:hypothetical protein